MTKREWSHLPNAKHIDWVLDTLKENPEVWKTAGGAATWDAAWNDAWGAVWGAAREAAWVAALDAARGDARDAARYAARYAACGAIAALVAWDDSSKLLDKPVEEVTELANESNHAAILLLPAVIVKHKLKENKMTKREWQIEMANRFAKRDNVKELTDEEIMELSYLTSDNDPLDFARAILRKAETRLKEQHDRIKVLELNHKIQLDIAKKQSAYIAELEKANVYAVNKLKECVNERENNRHDTGISEAIEFARDLLRKAQEK